MADPVSLAITVAITAAQMALTASQHFEGPRLTDLKATVADYGTPLNYVYGRRRIACPAFYAEPILERKKKRKGKGGKQTSYTGFLTFAVHLADHAIGSLRKVWFDQHLVYDATGSGDPLFPLAPDYELASFMRIYLGSAVQDPDPRMLASLTAAKGAGTCPAFLDQAYLFFEDVPAEQIGNRFPQVRAEIDAQAGAGTGVVLDFANAMYTINGASVTVTAAVEKGYLDFDYASIVAGVGLVNPADPYSDSGPRLTAAAFVAATGGNAAGGVSVTMDYFLRTDNIGDPNGPGAFVMARFANSIPPSTVGFIGWDFTSRWDLNPGGPLNTSFVGSFVYPPPYTGGAPVAMSGPGEHRATITFSPSGLNASIDGGAAGTIASPAALTASSFYINANVSVAVPLNVPLEAGAIIRRVKITPLAPIGGASGSPTLGQICADVAARSRLATGDYDFTALDQQVPGYSWTQGSGRAIIEPLLALFDSQVRPHDFILQGIKRGAAPGAALADPQFAAGQAPGQHYSLTATAETDLPQRLALTFADSDAEQQPNTAVVQRVAAATGSVRDQSLDMGTVALSATLARQLLGRVHRRRWFARASAQFALSRQWLRIEPGDVHAATIAGAAITLAATKLTVQADGVLAAEWEQDDPALAVLPPATGAPAAGHVASTIFNPAPTTGAVLDLPLLSDAHNQSAPLAYLVAAPLSDAGTWPGADFAVSNTGELDSYTEGWGAVSSGSAAVFGTVTGALNSVDPFVFDGGSSVSVKIESGTLAGATLDDLLLSGTRNLALIGPAGGGGELVQFRTATLTAPLTYTLTGFLRGVRGTEAAVAGHVTAERFVLLEGAAIPRTLGAAELGDTDWYIASTVGRTPNQTSAKPLAFTGQAHRPYSPVNGRATLSAGDWSITATRRTRIGGATLNGQDVPLGEVSQAWEGEVMDGVTVKRTLTGTALPLVYTAAMQTTDWGAAQTSLTVRLYQINPALSLRGALLTITG